MKRFANLQHSVSRRLPLLIFSLLSSSLLFCIFPPPGETQHQAQRKEKSSISSREKATIASHETHDQATPLTSSHMHKYTNVHNGTARQRLGLFLFVRLPLCAYASRSPEEPIKCCRCEGGGTGNSSHDTCAEALRVNAGGAHSCKKQGHTSHHSRYGSPGTRSGYSPRAFGTLTRHTGSPGTR
jgi:hypothetical protein